MQRAHRLFDRILDRENLRLAFYKALRGKRAKADARAFQAKLDQELREMAECLAGGVFRLGGFHQFTIRDPKQRLITAPSFRDRVLHHAIMNVCEPVFERWLIADTYACRLGKGRVAAVARTQQFARRWPFFLKLDIRKYFDSISHDVLAEKLQRLFKDPRLLELLRGIIEGYRVAPGRGLPIGSLTSQHFANFYLGWFDRFVKQTLRVQGYVRYMDDCALWGNSTAELRSQLAGLREFLGQELCLEIKPHPYINSGAQGMDFLGARVYGDHSTLNRRSRVRFRRKMRALESQFADGELSQREMQQRSTALVAFSTASGVASWRFRRDVLRSLAVSGQGLDPDDPGRKLEQLRQELPVGEPQQQLAGEPQQQPGLPPGRSSAGAVD